MTETEVRDRFRGRGDPAAGSCLEGGQDVRDMWPGGGIPIPAIRREQPDLI